MLLLSLARLEIEPYDHPKEISIDIALHMAVSVAALVKTCTSLVLKKIRLVLSH